MRDNPVRRQRFRLDRVSTLIGLLLSVVTTDVGNAQPTNAETKSSRDRFVQQAADAVDQMLRDECPRSATGRKPTPKIDDYAFLRRATLDLIGHLPTLAEIDQFVNDESPDKRNALIEKRLNDPRFGENWAQYWRDVIMVRRTEPRAILAAETLVEYLAQQFNQNAPWDQIVKSFITANGDISQNGATALIAAQGGRPEETVAELARVFLGMQIQCAQCHDHPTDQWTREQFHELAAFFPRTFMRPNRKGDKRSFMVTHRDFPTRFRPKMDRYFGELEHFMSDLEDPAAEGTEMEPVFFVSGQSMETGATDDERRAALAAWMTDPQNEWFAKALVNRVWAELIGVGFYDPVDDIGPERKPAAPRTLDFLAQQFVESGHDLKWLYQTIMATELYQRKSTDREPGTTPWFQSTHQQRLRSDQILNAMASVVSFDVPAIKNRLKGAGGRGPRAMFAATFGYDPSEVRSEITGSVPQAMLLMNGAVLDRLISADRRGGLGRLLQTEADNKQLLNRLYLMTLSRPANKKEVQTALVYIRRSETRSEAFEDILWALVNSSEFIHRG